MINQVKTLIKKCKDCEKIFSITSSQRQRMHARGFEEPVRCERCRGERRATIHIQCSDCDGIFSMSQRDVDFYDKQGYQQPKRCLECRDKRRRLNGNRK